MKQTPTLPPQQVLDHIRENYKYDPSTGTFWRKTGSQNSNGYVQLSGSFGPRGSNTKWTVRAHRAAFYLMTGAWPEESVDHINRDRADNRWGNLRLCNFSQNMRNRGAWGKVKARGVTLSGVKSRPYMATIGTWPNREVIGYFKTEDEASEAYKDRANQMYKDFSPHFSPE